MKFGIKLAYSRVRRVFKSQAAPQGMERTAEEIVNRRDARSLALPLCAILILGGCSNRSTEPTLEPSSTRTAARPPAQGRDVIPPGRQEQPKFSYDTDKDRRFADFLRDNSGGMVRQAAVGIEREGKLRVQVDRSVSPDDTLPLTKSILNGARKDFPGKAFTLSVYDPQGEPILRAHVDPETGVRYQVAHEDGEPSASGSRPSESGTAAAPLVRSGRTEADQKFADWAEQHGRDYLRYVQADLERHGRLWFGVDASGQARRRARPDPIAAGGGAQGIPRQGNRSRPSSTPTASGSAGPISAPTASSAGSTEAPAIELLADKRRISTMPQWGNQDYKKAVFEQLAQGSGGGEDDHFQHFENFSSGAPRRDVEAGVGEAFHPETLSSDEVEPQFRTAAQKMHPNERSEIAQDSAG